MKAVVFAYHDMGLEGLGALERHGFTIEAVFSHDDDPGETIWFGSVRDWAAARGIPLHCPANVNAPEWVSRIRALSPDILFSFYYRKMLRLEILDIPPKGAFNLHGSLLPSYRGRCPVNWVLVNGEPRTGVTLHCMTERADAGDLVGQREVPIGPDETARGLYRKLCDASGRLLDELLPLIKAGTAPRIPQDSGRASYFGGRRPEDGKIDWAWDARRIFNLIRAVTDPYPGAYSFLPDGRKLMIWWARPVAGETSPSPGTVVVSGNEISVSAGEGALVLLDVDIEGERLDSREKINAFFRDCSGVVLT